MELELQRTCLNGFQMVLERTVVQEETLESIVPDACPDMLRIVDTDGQVCLTARDFSAGSLRVTGIIRASVLYIPDGEDGPRHMDISLPFTCTVDDPALHSGCSVIAVPRICGIDARALNPRKVLLRGELAVSLRVYSPSEKNPCTGVACGCTEGGIQQKLTRQEAYLVCASPEKAFTFSDVLNLSASRPRAEELLRAKVGVRNLEAKMIGSKIVLKGEAELTVLCRAEGGTVFSHRFQLPYSQIMEVNGAGEECDVTVEPVVTGLECTLQAGDPGAVAVTMELLAQATVWEKQQITLLSDLYCTHCPLEVEQENFSVDRLLGEESRRESVRQFCECGILAKTVVDCTLSMGRLSRNKEDGGAGFRVETSVTILFISEDDALCSVTYPIPVGSQVAAGEDCHVLCRCSDAGGLTAVPVTGGLEVRFELEFSFLVTQNVPCPCVGGVRELPIPAGEAERPSVVLRMVGEGEELWDIAKSCGSTISDIMAANELEQELAPAGMLLLIPRSR